MKYTALFDKLDFTWDQLIRGFWHRYPNPKSGHVLAEDTFHRELRDGLLITKRLIKKRNSISLPKWGDKLCPKFVFVVEESIIDHKNKTITTYTRNLGSTTVCTVHEKCVYKPQSESNFTTLKREVFIKSFLRFVGGAIESIGVRSFQTKTAPNSTWGFNYVLTKMYRPHELREILLETKEKSKELLLDSKEKSKELISASKEKMKESAHKIAEKSKETLHQTSEKSKEKLMATKIKVRESAHHVAEKSKEKVKESANTLTATKDKMRESAHLVAEMSKENLKDSKEKI